MTGEWNLGVRLLSGSARASSGVTVQCSDPVWDRQKGTGLPSWGAPREQQLGRKKPSGAEQKQIDLSRRFYPLELEVLTLVAELSRAHCLGVLCSQVCNVSSWAFNVTGMKCSLKLIWLTLAASDINCRFEDEKKPVTVSTLQELSSWETIQRGEGHSWERWSFSFSLIFFFFFGGLSIPNLIHIFWSFLGK